MVNFSESGQIISDMWTCVILSFATILVKKSLFIYFGKPEYPLPIAVYRQYECDQLLKLSCLVFLFTATHIYPFCKDAMYGGLFLANIWFLDIMLCYKMDLIPLSA